MAPSNTRSYLISWGFKQFLLSGVSVDSGSRRAQFWHAPATTTAPGDEPPMSATCGLMGRHLGQWPAWKLDAAETGRHLQSSHTRTRLGTEQTGWRHRPRLG